MSRNAHWVGSNKIGFLQTMINSVKYLSIFLDINLWIRGNKRLTIAIAFGLSALILLIACLLGRPDRGGCLLIAFAILLAIPKSITDYIIVRIDATDNSVVNENARQIAKRALTEQNQVLLPIELTMAFVGTLFWGFG